MWLGELAAFLSVIANMFRGPKATLKNNYYT